MRRVATFIVALGFTVIGIEGSTVSPAWAAPGVAGARTAMPAVAVPVKAARVKAVRVEAVRVEAVRVKAARVKTAQVKTAQVKTIRFGGYMIDVPAGWPVYWLDSHPTTCVRYDRNAVYLGQPGANQHCTARIVGRVATISLQALSAAGTPAAGLPGASGPAVFPAVGNLPQVGGSVVADSQDHELYAALQHPGLSVSATYGSDATSMIKIIQSVRRSSSSGSAVAQQAAGTTAAPVTAPETVGGGGSASGPAVSAGRANTANGPVVGKGFDTCAAPSLAVMQAWRNAFSYAGIYIGGSEVGCGYGNLSAAWIRSVTALGWGLMPTYVGRQPTCDKRFKVRIIPSLASAEGAAAAEDAVRHAAALGMGHRTPIYYDMESFDTTNTSCKATVLAFLDAWTRELHVSGYVSGVYSSASTGAEALGWTTSVNGHSMAEPDSLWFALWDGISNVSGTPYLLDWWWAASRSKQYMGGHTRNINGFALDIDADLVRGAVYRLGLMIS